MKVLITGAGGQLGSDLLRVFSEPGHHEVIGATRRRLDVSDREGVLQAVPTMGPNLIIHAGAWADVDRCETDPDGAMAVNAFGSRNIAEAAAIVGAHVVYVSTDYVFDGRSGRPYTEWDPTNPLSVYGTSKLAGERECLQLVAGATVVRTSWVWSDHGSNIVSRILQMSKGGAQLRFVEDQVGCPTNSGELANAIYRLGIARAPGIFHVVNQGAASRFELAREVLRAVGTDPDRVVPIKTSEIDPPRPATRPAYSVLDNLAMRLAGFELLGPYQESLRRVLGSMSS